MEHSFNFFMHISFQSILLLVVAFSLAFVGTVAAIEDSNAVRNISQAYVIPYGYLPSGTPVTSGFSLNVIGVYPSGGEEDFFTDLVQANWSYTVFVNGVENVRPVVSGSSFTISGFELSYRPSDVVTVSVMVEGEAPVVDSPLKNFTVLKAQSLFGNGTVIPGSIVTMERQTAATQPPFTDFTAHPTSGTAPLTVSFTDSSSGNPTGWAWYFGDEDYTAPWIRMNASSGWSARYAHTSVVMPDGSIVLMGGYRGDAFLNDVWQSMDYGATWIQVNKSAGWSGRYGHSSVAMPDGSIILMGGQGDGSIYLTNDTWRSTDYGATWMQMNASSGWTRRTVHTSVAMADGSIVLMGGEEGGVNFSGLIRNDVWRSTDDGATWIQMNASAGWTGRTFPRSVAMPDGSIVLMGGYDGSFKNDVWRSSDKGATWTQVTPSAEWSERSEFASVAMPDGSIVLTGGVDSSGLIKNDVWRSTDDGATWIQVNASAGWTGRIGHTSMVMPDGSIILIGGQNGYIYNNDVWRFDPITSTVQNPSHTYTTPGTYQVALQAYNTGGYNSTRKTSYITVYPSGDSGSGSSDDIPSLIITPGKTITQTVNVGGGSAVTRAELTGTNLGKNLVITAFPQDNLPSTIAVPQTTVYQYISITSSTIPGVVNQTTLDFKIPKAWLTEHDFTAGDIVMIHYDNMQWQALDTMYVSQNSGNVFYRATTDGFSYFAIVYQKGSTDIGTGTPVVTPVQPVTAIAVVPVTDADLTIPITTEKTQAVPTTPVTIPSEAIPLTTIIVGGLGVVAIITSAFLIRRWWIRKQNPALFRKDK